MTMITPSAVSILTFAQLTSAARVLRQAFDRYPLTRYAFAAQEARYGELLERMFRLTLSRRAAYEGLVLGAFHGQALAGVAGLSVPGHPEMPARMREAMERFEATIGPEARERFGAYEAIVERHRPREPHLYLGVLGVQPFLKGRGYGRALLDAAHAAAKLHPEARGVYLDTQHAANVELYAHFGYELVGEERAGPVGVWCMYRPNRPR